jgi:hypothetical protein
VRKDRHAPIGNRPKCLNPRGRNQGVKESAKLGRCQR